MPSSKLETALKYSWQFEAIGTQWLINTSTPIPEATRHIISSYIHTFDHQLSRFRPDSLVSQLAVNATTIQLDPDLLPLLEWYEKLEAITQGIVTPTIGTVIADAGYDANYSLQPKATPKPALPYTATIQRKGTTLTALQPVMLDYGAAGKGFLVDAICELLHDEGFTDFAVDGSGDVRQASSDPTTFETIGLQDPTDKTKVIGVIELRNKALCASATTGRAWGEWHHVINARTAKPAQDIIATWVVADSTMIADGIATALFFVPPETIPTRYTYEYLRIFKDGSYDCSDYFREGVFS